MSTTRLQTLPADGWAVDPSFGEFTMPDITTGLLALFTIDDLTATTELAAWPRHSGSNAAITMSGSATLSRRPDVLDDSGLVVRFTRADSQFLSTASALPAEIETLTLAMRIKLRALPGSGLNSVLFCNVGAATFTVDLTPAGSVRVNGGGTIITASAILAALETWHTLAVTLSGNDSTVYLDGAPVLAGTVASTARVQQPRIAAAQDASNGADVDFRHFAMYDRVLSQADMEALHFDWS